MNEIRGCLNSLTRQSFKDFEVLVCDDASTDDTRSVVEAFRHVISIRYLRLEKNSGGAARPRNLGIDSARGKYIAFLDSDDMWTADKLKMSVDAILQGSDFVYHDLFETDLLDKSTTGKKIVRTRSLRDNAFEDLLLNGNAITTSSVLVKTTLIREIGGFRDAPSLVAIEDYEAWLRLAKLGIKMTRINGCLGYYQPGQKSLSKSGRDLNNLRSIKILYRAEYRGLGYSCPTWLSYRVARLYFDQASYRAAGMYYLSLALETTSPARIRLAALFFLVRIFFNTLKK